EGSIMNPQNFSGSRRAMWQTGFLVTGAVLAVLLGSAALVVIHGGQASSPPARHGVLLDGSTRSISSTIASGAPRTPPARICDSRGLLNPSKRPAGALRIPPAKNRETIVNNAAEGATFWLTPGVHRLATDMYDQLIPKNGQTFIGAP